MWEFAQHSPYLTFFAFWIACYAATRPFYFAWSAYNRHLRSKNIAAHGWPTAPVDADGDVVYPDKDED